MERPIFRSRAFWLCGAFSFALIATQSAQAANTWDGGGADDNWGTLLNWDNDLVPVWPQAITFAGTVRPNPNNDQVGITLNGINFATGAAAFTLGGNGVTLNGGITDNATNAQRINLA